MRSKVWCRWTWAMSPVALGKGGSCVSRRADSPTQRAPARPLQVGLTLSLPGVPTLGIHLLHPCCLQSWQERCPRKTGLKQDSCFLRERTPPGPLHWDAWFRRLALLCAVVLGKFSIDSHHSCDTEEEGDLVVLYQTGGHGLRWAEALTDGLGSSLASTSIGQQSFSNKPPPATPLR